MALTNKLSAIGNAIRAKTGKSAKLTLDEMPSAIASIETGGGGELPEEAFFITGDCNYRFANNGWNWFSENYGNKVTTDNIVSAAYMFANSSNLTKIPFEINMNTLNTTQTNYMFYQCSSLRNLPKINNCKAVALAYIFYGCALLRELPQDITNYFDWSYIDKLATPNSGNQTFMFANCYSLRSIPIDFLSHGNPYGSYTVAYFSGGFNCCYVLDELANLPIPYIQSTWTSNAFASTFSKCGRLKHLTFNMPNGAPIVVKWKAQVIDLTNYVGYTNDKSHVLKYNSGITADKEVIDDATYQALKNDPDWWTRSIVYCRYNHDSAVATINSLPDTSTYLATAGGTNTIKFKGAAGSATDGGAINTLTADEIAVATAKGWTVTLV